MLACASAFGYIEEILRCKPPRPCPVSPIRQSRSHDPNSRGSLMTIPKFKNETYIDWSKTANCNKQEAALARVRAGSRKRIPDRYRERADSCRPEVQLHQSLQPFRGRRRLPEGGRRHREQGDGGGPGDVRRVEGRPADEAGGLSLQGREGDAQAPLRTERDQDSGGREDLAGGRCRRRPRRSISWSSTAVKCSGMPATTRW